MLETFTNVFLWSVVLCAVAIIILLAFIGLIKLIIEIPNWLHNKTKSDTASGLIMISLLIIGISTVVATLMTIIITWNR